MNEMNKTIAFAGVALVLLAAAAAATWLPDWRGPGVAFNDQGEPFFPTFSRQLEDDPLAATVLEVVEYDEDTASVRPFQVELKDGRWTIPSHHDYPADAETRLATIAAQVARLKKDTIRSDRPLDHEDLGVIDPLDEKSTTLKGRGTRVTLRDEPGGTALADLIIGDEVPNRPEQRYVRVPGRNRVYGVNLDLDLSTTFADWIDTNLLNVNVDQVQSITFDKRKVDPDQMRLLPGEIVTIRREQEGDDSTSTQWVMDGLDADEQIDITKVSDLIRAVDGLRIVGVRPLPSNPNAQGRSLVSRGFYPTQEHGLLSNQGSVSLATNEGLVYTLRFGEVTFATGTTLTAGAEEGAEAASESDAPEDSAERDGESQSGQTESRFVFLTVAFDPSLLPAPDANALDELKIPDDVFARAPDDPIRIEQEAQAQEEAERKERERQERIEEGERTAEELNEVFTAWYYVVPGSDFRRVMVDESTLLTSADADVDVDVESPLPGISPTPTFELPEGLELPPGHP